MTGMAWARFAAPVLALAAVLALCACGQEQAPSTAASGVFGSASSGSSAAASSPAAAPSSSAASPEPSAGEGEGASSSATVAVAPGDVATISAADLAAALASKEAPFALDVRARGDYYDSFIEDSKNIPAGRQLALRADEVPRDRPVVVVGGDDASALECCGTLVEAGVAIESLSVLDGGIRAWQEAGLPTQTVIPASCG